MELMGRPTVSFRQGGLIMSRFLGQTSSGETGHHTRRNRSLSSEQLEDRSLMSSSLWSSFIPSPPSAPPLSPRVVSNELPKNVSGRIEGLYELSLTRHHLYQSVIGSRVLEAPMFLTTYIGPKHPDLDIVGSSAQLNSQQIMFSGKVLSPINDSQVASYSFLVNRGGAHSPGPIVGLPKKQFDASIQITTGSGGISGTVSLLNSQGEPMSMTSLTASLVQISGATIRVTVPLSLLPSTAPQGTHGGTSLYSYTFLTGIPGTSGNDIAGFAPMYIMAIVDASGGHHH